MSSRVFGIALQGNASEISMITGALSEVLPAGCSVWSPPEWDQGFPDQVDGVCEINLRDEHDHSEAETVALLTQAIEAVDPDGGFIVARDAPSGWSRINDRLFARPQPAPERTAPTF
jgi:hypothetical protein